MNSIEQKMWKIINEASLTGGPAGSTGLTDIGDAWPDGIYTRYGERRFVGPGAMPRGMKQLVAPASDSIYGGEGSLRPMGLPRTKVTPEYLKSGEVIDPHKDIRSDEPPLSPKMRLYGRRAFGKPSEYIIPHESANFVTTGGPEGEDILIKPTTPPEGSIRTGGSEEGAIEPTPEPGSMALGSKSGYRQVQKGGLNLVRGTKGSVNKMYIDKMLGKYNSKREGIKESPTAKLVNLLPKGVK